MTLASALWTFEKNIFQRGDLHVLLAQQSNKDLETNWSYWGACRGSGALKTLACVAGIWKGGETFKCLPRRLLKHWVTCSKRSDSLPRFYFFALLFTSHRSPLSERLEQAKHWGALHRKFGKSGKWYGKSRKSVQKFRKLLNFRNANLTIQPKILEIPGAKLDGKKTSGKKFFEHLDIPREVVLFFGNFEKSCSIHYWKLPKILTGRFGWMESVSPLLIWDHWKLPKMGILGYLFIGSQRKGLCTWRDYLALMGLTALYLT